MVQIQLPQPKTSIYQSLRSRPNGRLFAFKISEALRKQKGARDCEFMRNDNRRIRTKTGVGRRAAASPTRQRLTLRQPFSDGRAVCNTYRTINTKGRFAGIRCAVHELTMSWTAPSLEFSASLTQHYFAFAVRSSRQWSPNHERGHCRPTLVAPTIRDKNLRAMNLVKRG